MKNNEFDKINGIANKPSSKTSTFEKDAPLVDLITSAGKTTEIKEKETMEILKIKTNFEIIKLDFSIISIDKKKIIKK